MKRRFDPVATSPRAAASTDAFDRLLFLGWRGALALPVAGLAFSFFLYGYALVYWLNADMDLFVVYNALALNDGKPQQFFDHTAYLTIVSLKAWFQLLHEVGLLAASSLSSFPAASDPAAFDAAMTSAVRAGRLLAWLIAIASVLIFTALMCLVVRDWRVALLATQAFALSGGIAVHSRILRSELVAACPIIFALMILIVVGRRAGVLRPLAMAGAAALCVIGLENKVQAILLIGALPLMVLPFGSTASASVGFWRHSRLAWLAALIAAIAAVAALWAAWHLIATGFDQSLLETAKFRPLLFGRFGTYQAALLLLICGCMIVYAGIWRVSAAETLAAMFAVAAGASIALLLLELQYNANNVIAVFNPLEKLMTFADAKTIDAIHSPISLLFKGIASVLARYTFVLHSSPRPAVFLVWLIIPGIIVAWRRGGRLAAAQATGLMLAAICIDAVAVQRGLKSEYFIFTDPLIILAGAVLLDSLADLRFHRWTLPVALVLLGLHITVGQAEAIKYAFMRRGPESICEWRPHYMPLLALPWCPALPRQ